MQSALAWEEKSSLDEMRRMRWIRRVDSVVIREHLNMSIGSAMMREITWWMYVIQSTTRMHVRADVALWHSTGLMWLILSPSHISFLIWIPLPFGLNK